MTGGTFTYVALGALAIALLHAVYTDIKRREIEHWLNAGIALAAPLFWWQTGLSLWPDIALQIGVAVLIFAIFYTIFCFGAMGGGDVKLITALSLWFPWQYLLQLIVVMSLIGGVLTLAVAVEHKIKKRAGQPEIPYGVAIAAAGLWLIGERYFNHFT